MPITKPNYALWEIEPNQFPQNNEHDQLKFICAYGLLAPSSHNTQPWKFIIKHNSIEIHADLNRRLKAADPTNKELYISVGCTIPNIEMAAGQFGMHRSTTLLPDPQNSNHIATVNVNPPKSANITPHPLFPYISKRLTNRSLYKKDRPLPTAYTSELQQFLSDSDIRLALYSDKEILNKLAVITKDGMYSALSKPAFRQELSHWVRHSWTDKGDGLPANTLGIPDAFSLAIATMVRSPLMPKTSSDLEYKMINSSSAVGVLYSPKNDLIHWIKSGIAYSYIALTTCKHKLAIEPLSASIEMPQQRHQLLQLVKEKAEPMMFFRIGFAKKRYPHAPRRQIDDVVSIS